jgi:hypothetical protein
MSPTIWKAIVAVLLGAAAFAVVIAVVLNMPIVLAKVLGITLLFIVLVLGGAFGASARMDSQRRT